MVAIGCVYLHLPTNELEAEQRDLAALWLCAAGLIATFLTGYVGYIVINAIWPSFYYTPIKAGKNIWLIAGTQHPALSDRRRAYIHVYPTCY